LLAARACAAGTATAIVTAQAIDTVGCARAGAVDVTHHAVGAAAAGTATTIVAACTATARRLTGNVKTLAGRQEALVVAGTSAAGVGAAVVATDAPFTIRRAWLIRELVEVLRERSAIAFQQWLTGRHRPVLNCALQNQIGETAAVRVVVEVDARRRARSVRAGQ
jgi:hypothetical protein